MTCEDFLPNKAYDNGFHAWVWEESLTTGGLGLCSTDNFRVIEVEDSPENLVRLGGRVKFRKGTILGAYSSVKEAVREQGL